MRKSVVVLLMGFTLLFTACGGKNPAPQNLDSQRTLTSDELKKFDGQNGNAAYVAVDGIIYDVTLSKLWKNGIHKGYEAGKDLTKEIKGSSPHGAAVMKRFPVVGKLGEK